jgi:hypothetical protein
VPSRIGPTAPMLDITLDGLAPMVDRLIPIVTAIWRSLTRRTRAAVAEPLECSASALSRRAFDLSSLAAMAPHGAHKGPHTSSKKGDRARRRTISKLNGPLGVMLATSSLIRPWLWAILKIYLIWDVAQTTTAIHQFR